MNKHLRKLNTESPVVGKNVFKERIIKSICHFLKTVTSANYRRHSTRERPREQEQMGWTVVFTESDSETLLFMGVVDNFIFTVTLYGTHL